MMATAVPQRPRPAARRRCHRASAVRPALRAGMIAASLSACLACAAPGSSEAGASGGPPPGPAGDAVRSAAEPWEELAVPDEDAGLDARTRFPYTREQIRRILSLHRAQQRALGLHGRPDAYRSRSVSIAPGQAHAPDGDAPPPVINAARGYTTALVFLDVTGAPWPVSRALMRPEFRVEEPAEPRAGHIVYLAPQREWDHGNVTVELAGLALPLSLAISVDDSGVVDDRVIVRLSMPGPNADPRALAAPARLRAGDPVLDLFATGAVPDGAVRLTAGTGTPSAGACCPVHRAWRYRDWVWLRTPHLLLAPAAHAAARGPDGSWVYMLPDTPLVLLAPLEPGAGQAPGASRESGAPLRLRLGRPLPALQAARRGEFAAAAHPQPAPPVPDPRGTLPGGPSPAIGADRPEMSGSGYASSPPAAFGAGGTPVLPRETAGSLPRHSGNRPAGRPPGSGMTVRGRENTR